METCDPAWLSELRNLLLAGLGTAAVLAVLVWERKPTTKARKTDTYCPLHRVERSDCEEKHR